MNVPYAAQSERTTERARDRIARRTLSIRGYRRWRGKRKALRNARS